MKQHVDRIFLAAIFTTLVLFYSVFALILA